VFALNSSLEEDNISVEEAVEAKEFIEFSDISPNDNRSQIISNDEEESNGLISRSTTFTNDDSLLSCEITAQSSPQSLESGESDEGNLNRSDARVPSQVLMPPVWVPDELVSHCPCSLQFTIIRRRHHCRNCGQIYCHNCSNHFIPLACYGYLKPVRVCNVCHQQLQQFSNSNT
jgi:hypothetical protein